VELDPDGDFILVYPKMKSEATAPRRYNMERRARAVAETRRRILAATFELHRELYFDQVTLTAIAQRAGVTEQTVLQHFGSKDALIAAAAEEAREHVAAQRDEAPVGDIPAAVANLVDHYEEWGDGVIRLLAQEDRIPDLRKHITDPGRAYHRAWVERTFAPLLAGRRGLPRKRRLAELIAVTDVYTWKLLRRDLGLDKQQTETAIRELVTALRGERA
jgi:AcrR family transcriptional regulator